MIEQLLINVIRVPAGSATLGPGDSVTIDPGLFSNQKPVVPTLIQPDRGSPIIVDQTQPITATSVTFTNTGVTPAFAYFRFERGLSNEVDAADLVPSYWAGVTASGGGGFAGVNATSPIASSAPGGPVTTISLDDSGVAPDTYGDNSVLLDESKMPIVTVTAKGLVSTASEEAIRIGGDPAKQYVDNAASTAETNAKNYAQELAFGVSSKEPAHAATVAALPAYSGATQVLTGTVNGPIPPATTDGQTLLFGERLLVKNETGGNEKYNGIYELTQVGSITQPWILTRTNDADTDETLCGSLVTVQTGLVNAGTLWIFAANPAVFNIGSDPVIWNPIAFPNASVGAPGAVQLTGGLGGNSTAYNLPTLDADYINKGTLAVARGGTGTGSLTARAVPVVNAGGTALTSVSPGTLNNVLKSNGTDWVSGPIPSVPEAQTYYVAVDGNDTTGNGSAAAPFATIQKAHDVAATAYTSGEDVVINVGPGTFSGDVSISRVNTFIVGQGKRPEDQVTKITGTVYVACTTATQINNQQVGIDGCFIEPLTTSTNAALVINAPGAFSVVVTNCYLTTTNSSASAVNSINDTVRLVLWNCIATTQAATSHGDILYIDGGTYRISDTQLLHGGLVTGGTGRAISVNGNSYFFGDRLLIETRNNRNAVRFAGGAYSGATSKAVLSNCGITTTGTSSGGVEGVTAGLPILLTDIFFTVPAGRPCIDISSVTTPVAYGQLSFAPGSSTTLTVGSPAYNNEAHGEMYLNALTASLPLKLNASKKMISQAIALASEVSGTLPVGNGGTGTGTAPTQWGVIYGASATSYASTAAATNTNRFLRGNNAGAPTWDQINLASSDVTGTLPLASVAGPTGVGFGYTSATGVWSSSALTGTDKLVGFNGSTPAAITVGSGLSLSAGTLSVTGGGTVTSVGMSGGTSGLTFTSDTANPITTSGTFTLSGTLAIANGGTGNGSTVTANTVFAGPSTGVPGAPYYRALVPADIPAIPASGVTGIPYDIAGAVAGVPTALDTVFRFVAVRACTIAATGHRALCASAPASTTDFDIQLDGVPIGRIRYTSAGTTGTVTITSGLPVSVATGQRVEIVAPPALNAINSPFFTLAAVL